METIFDVIKKISIKKVENSYYIYYESKPVAKIALMSDEYEKYIEKVISFINLLKW